MPHQIPIEQARCHNDCGVDVEVSHFGLPRGHGMG